MDRNTGWRAAGPYDYSYPEDYCVVSPSGKLVTWTHYKRDAENIARILNEWLAAGRITENAEAEIGLHEGRIVLHVREAGGDV